MEIYLEDDTYGEGKKDSTGVNIIEYEEWEKWQQRREDYTDMMTRYPPLEDQNTPESIRDAWSAYSKVYLMAPSMSAKAMKMAMIESRLLGDRPLYFAFKWFLERKLRWRN